MSYSHARLRNTLAVVRMAVGALFLFSGTHKISSLEFARFEFPDFLRGAINGGAVHFYAEFLSTTVWQQSTKFAVLIAFVELFLGVGLLLGLAVRPIALLGLAYTAHLMLSTWMAPGSDQPLWLYLQNETEPILLSFLLLIFGIGHAGENWGVGSLYHRRRHRKWENGASVEPLSTAGQDVRSGVFAYDEAPDLGNPGRAGDPIRRGSTPDGTLRGQMWLL